MLLIGKGHGEHSRRTKLALRCPSQGQAGGTLGTMWNGWDADAGTWMGQRCLLPLAIPNPHGSSVANKTNARAKKSTMGTACEVNIHEISPSSWLLSPCWEGSMHWDVHTHPHRILFPFFPPIMAWAVPVHGAGRRWGQMVKGMERRRDGQTWHPRKTRTFQVLLQPAWTPFSSAMGEIPHWKPIPSPSQIKAHQAHLLQPSWS